MHTKQSEFTYMSFTILPFFQGLGIGFVVAIIVGPVAVLCIRRTLTDGQAVGLAIGIGASAADTVFAFIASFGLTLISDFLVRHQQLFKFIGGVFLLYLGLKIFLEKPATTPAESPKRKSLIGIALSIFFLTLSNPATIFSFALIFTVFGIASQGDFTSTIELVSGVFSGSLCWFAILTSVLALFHRKISQETLVKINKVSGATIMVFGLVSIASILVVKTIC